MTHIDVSNENGRIESLCGNAGKADVFIFGDTTDRADMRAAAEACDCPDCKRLAATS